MSSLLQTQHYSLTEVAWCRWILGFILAVADENVPIGPLTVPICYLLSHAHDLSAGFVSLGSGVPTEYS